MLMLSFRFVNNKEGCALSLPYPNFVSSYFLFYFIFKIHLGINGKMHNGYKELIHENTTTISTSTNMSNSKLPHASNLETVFTPYPNFVSSFIANALFMNIILSLREPNNKAKT